MPPQLNSNRLADHRERIQIKCPLSTAGQEAVHEQQVRAIASVYLPMQSSHHESR